MIQLCLFSIYIPHSDNSHVRITLDGLSEIWLPTLPRILITTVWTVLLATGVGPSERPGLLRSFILSAELDSLERRGGGRALLFEVRSSAL